jgi:hypothetical protein
MLPADARTFNDVFVVLELMPTDLTRVLRSKIDLSNEHIRWLAYQLLRGVHHIHSANVFHRDLKPSNILINAACDLRICDFGLARAQRLNADDNDAVFWTDYVATRWYRAPELIMTHYTHYTTAIDMWSLGCILAEMFNNGKPLFPGVNAIDQLEKIVGVTGTPTAGGLHAVRNPKARDHLLSMPKRPRRPLCAVLAKQDDPDAVTLLESILQFDPAARPSAAQALAHPYFASLHDPDVLAGSDADAIPIEEFDFERQRLSIDDIRLLFLDEILKYHPGQRDVYTAPGAAGGSLRVDQAGRFGEAMRARENGLQAPPPYASMPTQRMGSICDDVAAAYAARTGGCAPVGAAAAAAAAAARPAREGRVPDGDPMDMEQQASYGGTAPAATSSTYAPAARAGGAEEGPESQMSASGAHQVSETAEMSGVDEAAGEDAAAAAAALVAPF